MKSSNRKGNIELLRFLFALAILLHHTTLSFLPMRRGYLSVEFFFVLTGLFLAERLSIDKELHRKEPFECTLGASRKELISRARKLYPYFITGTVVAFAIDTYLNAGIASDAIAVIGDVLLLQSFGIPTKSYSGVVWFLSSMFIALWILYPLFRKYYETYVKYFSAGVGLFLLGIITINFGNLCTPDYYLFGMFSTGVMRAVAMISLGGCAYELGKKLSAHSQSAVTGAATLIAELVLYTCIFCYMAFVDGSNGRYDALVAIGIVVVVALTYSQTSPISNWLDNDINRHLGRLSSVIFLIHFPFVSRPDLVISRLSLPFSEDLVKLLFLCIALLISAVTDLVISSVLRAKR